ncbi:MAG: site-specific integrase [Alphaproteobacteria bacterium]|nr:site-specific integrase [Alphaproteobacteria bacterium]
MPTPYKIKGSKNYYVKITDPTTGKRKELSLRTSNKKVANERARDLEDRAYEIRAFGEKTTDVWSFEQAADHYIDKVAPATVKPTVVKRYGSSKKKLVAFMGNLGLDEIDETHISNFIEHCRLEHENTIATINRDLDVGSLVFQAARTKGQKFPNAFSIYRDEHSKFLKEMREPFNRLTPAQMEVIRDNLPYYLQQAMDFALTTGMRQAEIVALTWNDIAAADDGYQIFIRRTKTSIPRVIRFPVGLGFEIAECKKFTPDARVLTNHEAEPIKHLSALWAKQITRIMKHKGVPRLSFHGLRHEFAIRYLERGGSIYVLQKHLGHRSIKTTEIYLDYLTPEQQERAKMGVAEVVE